MGLMIQKTSSIDVISVVLIVSVKKELVGNRRGEFKKKTKKKPFKKRRFKRS